MYGNFDIILDHFSRISQHHAASQTPCDVRYVQVVRAYWMLTRACNPMGGGYGWLLWVVAMGGCCLLDADSGLQSDVVTNSRRQACQFLYKHSLLPERGADGIRVNLTFRSKNPVRPARHAPSSFRVQAQAHDAPSRAGHGPDAGTTRDSAGTDVSRVSGASSLAAAAALSATSVSDTTFVGLAPGVDHRPTGWKNQLHHPFESPFVDDPPAQAAARYATWIQAQPVFFGWACRRLAGRTLAAGASEHDRAHADALSQLVASAAGDGGDASDGLQLRRLLELGSDQLPAVRAGELRIGNLQQVKSMHGREASRPLCRDFAKGRCQRGDGCRFSHEDAGPVGFAAVCVDRSSDLGNPYRMGTSGHDETLRDAACSAFAELLAALPGADPVAIGRRHAVEMDERFSDVVACENARRHGLQGLRSRLRRGESLRLLCWCAPRRCHAEEIARWLMGSLLPGAELQLDHPELPVVAGQPRGAAAS